MSSNPEDKLLDLNIKLTNPPTPAANYIPFVIQDNFVFISGTQDDTGGLVAGAEFFIDNIVVDQANPPPITATATVGVEAVEAAAVTINPLKFDSLEEIRKGDPEGKYYITGGADADKFHIDLFTGLTTSKSTLVSLLIPMVTKLRTTINMKLNSLQKRVLLFTLSVSRRLTKALTESVSKTHSAIPSHAAKSALKDALTVLGLEPRDHVHVSDFYVIQALYIYLRVVLNSS